MLDQKQAVQALKEEIIAGFNNHHALNTVEKPNYFRASSYVTTNQGPADNQPGLLICKKSFKLMKAGVDLFSADDLTDIILAALDTKQSFSTNDNYKFFDDTKFKESVIKFAIVCEKLSNEQMVSIFAKAQSAIWLNLDWHERFENYQTREDSENRAVKTPVKDRLLKLIDRAKVSDERKKTLKSFLDIGKKVVGYQPPAPV